MIADLAGTSDILIPGDANLQALRKDSDRRVPVLRDLAGSSYLRQEGDGLLVKGHNYIGHSYIGHNDIGHN